MKKEGYQYFNEENTIYTFLSKGKVDLPKVVIFQKINDNLFCLVLTDYNVLTGEISDETISNNGDITLIMATVIKIILDFISKNTDSCIILKGNTTQKQKLYNRIINNNYNELMNLITIKILKEEKLSDYILGNQYSEFYIYKK